MPTYEYACTSCGEHHDVVHSVHDDAPTACPACGGPLRKVFGSIGVVFKGSGFYKTDSRSSKRSDKPAEKSSEVKASGDGAPADKGSTDKKPSGDGASSASKDSTSSGSAAPSAGKAAAAS